MSVALFAAAVESTERQGAWDTILWVIAVCLFIAGVVWFYRAVTRESGRFAIYGVACWVLAALVGPTGASLLT